MIRSSLYTRGELRNIQIRDSQL